MIESHRFRKKEFPGPKRIEDEIFPVHQERYDYDEDRIRYEVLLNGVDPICTIALSGQGDFWAEWKTPLRYTEWKKEEKRFLISLNAVSEGKVIPLDSLAEPYRYSMTIHFPSPEDPRPLSHIHIPSSTLDVLDENPALLKGLSRFVASTETTIPPRRMEKILGGIFEDREILLEKGSKHFLR